MSAGHDRLPADKDNSMREIKYSYALIEVDSKIDHTSLSPDTTNHVRPESAIEVLPVNI